MADERSERVERVVAPAKSTKGKKEKGRSEQGQNPKKRIWKDWSTTEKFTFFIMVFTGTYTLITLYLYSVARQSLELDQRGWVGPSQITAHIQANAPLKFSIVFKNSGRTPAMNVTSKALIRQVSVSETFKPIWLGHPPEDFRAGTLHPGTTGLFTIEQGPPIPEQMLEGNIKTKVSKIYVYGTVTYDDVFGKRHKTEFCFTSDWDSSLVHSCSEGYSYAD